MLSPTASREVVARLRFCAIMSHRVCPVLARYELLRGKAMSKKLSGILVLCVSALWLSGCAYFRATGPCFGVGCPAHSVGQNGQYKPGQAPKAQTTAAQRKTAPGTQVAANAAVTSSPQPADVPKAAPQAAPAQAANPKPSVADKVGDFVAHLIPHHNKASKSAAATD
jgi:hypothetical protein